MNKKLFFSFVFVALVASATTFGQGCAGQFKTFSMGGWGTNCHGNNPGCYRDAHFDAAFPDGVEIGCGSNKLTFTSSATIANFLPSGGSPRALSGSSTDPSGSAVHNVLASQVLAVALAIGFDVNDPNFSASSANFGGLVIYNGPFAGKTVAQFLQIANDVLGGCSTQYSFSDVNAAATAINENFDGGTVDNGYLNCTARPFTLSIHLGIDPNVCGSDNSLVTLTINGGAPAYTIQIFNNNVLVSTMTSNDQVVYLGSLGTGTYSVKVTDSNNNVATGSW